MTPGGPELAAHLRAALGPGPVGVAVSGGGDSVALLHLAVRAGIAVQAVTVDHGLRAEAAAEAAEVARACAALGVPHDILRWQWDGRGNLQDAARRARQALIADWARGRGLGAVALAHTADDQAETLLMELARRAGVDGLSGMAECRRAAGVDWLRPLLGVTRAALRGWLAAEGIGWADDPTNADPRYARVRMRRALAGLGPVGIDAAGLSAVAGHLQAARAALAWHAEAAARRIAGVEAGDVVIDRAALAALPDETRRRILRAALVWIASAEYGPRAPALARAEAAALAGRAATLAGCRLLPGGPRLRITREARAVAATVTPTDALWDGRWRFEGPHSNGLTLRALGPAGLAACPDWRAGGLPRASLLAAPAVWRGEVLVAAPLAGRPAGWRAAPLGGADGFFSALLSH
ncbi:tRNA lysidine(34) synthetase TilS [Xinfangfangia sp. LG-4]|uniref:tRNA(Ile)-lysidine synthase n=1 Tax=Ruixingdingia sedimenti TaxID=3073604 RepID=A0ABU1FC94_9RHOB|nr:tRNA lysidine(34) synthetase TilS [Xinfangfangia sp. LG-4]MDR5654069.1 tRNA lysidine(34) synthetase TilS [Xinfangfangia sp. LG-4]